MEGGTADSSDIKAAGHKAGHSADSLKRARRKLRAEITQVGFPRRTTWTLPAPATVGASSGENAPTTPTTPTGKKRGSDDPQSEQLEQSGRPQETLHPLDNPASACPHEATDGANGATETAPACITCGWATDTIAHEVTCLENAS